MLAVAPRPELSPHRAAIVTARLNREVAHTVPPPEVCDERTLTHRIMDEAMHYMREQLGPAAEGVRAIRYDTRTGILTLRVPFDERADYRNFDIVNDWFHNDGNTVNGAALWETEVQT